MRPNAALSHQPYCVPVSDPSQDLLLQHRNLALLSAGGPVARFARGPVPVPVLEEDDQEDAPTKVLPSLRRSAPATDEHITFIDKALAPQIRDQIRERAARAARSARFMEAQQLLDEIADAQLTLDVNLDGLERLLEEVAYDPSSRAAADTMRARLDDMADIAEGLARVHLVAEHAAATPLLGQDTPLVDYIRGLVAWCNGVLRAYEQLAMGLRTPPVDWLTLRRRVEEAAHFYMPELTQGVRDEVRRLHERKPELAETFAELAEDLELLFAAAEWFYVSSKLRFG